MFILLCYVYIYMFILHIYIYVYMHIHKYNPPPATTRHRETASGDLAVPPFPARVPSTMVCGGWWNLPETTAQPPRKSGAQSHNCDTAGSLPKPDHIKRHRIGESRDANKSRDSPGESRDNQTVLGDKRTPNVLSHPLINNNKYLKNNNNNNIYILIICLKMK